MKFWRNFSVSVERLREDFMERYITVSNAKNIAMLGLLEKMAGEWDAWRYAWDMDPSRKMTSTGRWKSTQEMTAMK